MPLAAHLRLPMTFSYAPREFASIVNCSDCSFPAPAPRPALAAANPIRSYKRNCDFEVLFPRAATAGFVSLLSENKCTGRRCARITLCRGAHFLCARRREKRKKPTI